MEYLAQYALFLAESVTVLVVIALVFVVAANAAGRGRRGFDQGRIETRRLNDVLDDMRDSVRAVVLDEKALKKLHKEEEKAEKQRRKQDEARGRTWVLHFDGDLAATAVRALRNEVTAILTLAEPGDEVLACIESPGGMVHGYGLAASQLHRLRAHEGLSLTVAVDKVAASGGYM